MEAILLKIIRQKPRDSISNQMAALELYELSMGIQKGDGSEVPISLATMKDQREFVKDSDWGKTLRVLMKYKLHNSTGLNIFQQLELPRWKLRELLDAARDVAKAEPAIIKEISAEAEKAGKERARKQNK